MRLEARIEALQRFSEAEWESLLSLTNHQPHPGRFIIVPERLGSRRELIDRWLSEGVTRKDIARELGVSPGLITKIIKGQRR